MGNQAAAPAASATPPAPAPANPAAKGPEVPPSPAPAQGAAAAAPAAPSAPKAPQNQVEADLQKTYGEDWEKMPQAVRERVIVAEMKSREADKRMQLAAKLKKDLDATNQQAAHLIERLRKDPWGVLSNPALGHDTRKLAESYVWDMINEQRMKASMSPEQWDALQKGKAAQTELEGLKAQQEQAKKEQADREFEALKAQRRAYWEKAIPEAIDANGLPKISFVVRRFTDYIKAANAARMPADLPKIAEQIKLELGSIAPQLLLPPKREGETDESYEERVLASAPNDYIKILRKADLRKLRAKGIAPKPGPKPNASPAPKGNGKMLMSEWLNQRDARLGRK